MEVTRENTRKAEERRASHSWGNTHPTHRKRHTLQECLLGASLPVRLELPSGGERKIAQEERLPTFHRETKIRKREKGGGKVLRFTVFPLSGSRRKQRLGPEPGPSRDGSHSCLHPATPAPQAYLRWGVEGMSQACDLGEGRRLKPPGRETRLNSTGASEPEGLAGLGGITAKARPLQGGGSDDNEPVSPG